MLAPDAMPGWMRAHEKEFRWLVAMDANEATRRVPTFARLRRENDDGHWHALARQFNLWDGTPTPLRQFVEARYPKEVTNEHRNVKR